MLNIITALIFLLIAIVNTLLICGLPLGEFTMGGQHKILPKKLRILALLSLIVQIFAIVIILQAGGFLPLLFSAEITKIICFAYAIFLSLNTVMNFLSKSPKEKYVMTPFSLLASICFWISAFQM